MAESNDPEAQNVEKDKKDATNRDLSTGGNGKNFYQRVEEFSMWNDEGAFQEMEYKRRRSEKKKMKGAIKSDHLLIWSRRLYIPVIGWIVLSSTVLLSSTIEGLGVDTILWQHQNVFRILGGVCLTIGIIALMGIAAYSYHREDKVRAKCGYPSLFMSSLKGETSTKNMEETIMLQNTFVDKPRRYNRLNSLESKCSGNNLGNSFSSTGTAMSWVHKHRGYTAGLSRQSSIRRENSDSALDKIFARNRLLKWQTDGCAQAPETSDNGDGNTDNSEQNNSNVEEIPCDIKNQKVDVSQIESSVSMASSGYSSNTSTQCLSQGHNNCNTNKKKLLRHLSEPTQKVTVHHIAKRDRMLSDGIIPDDETFEDQEHSVVISIPIINIECV